ncbi:unnamed protein product, partial [Mesorhabditis spiculigera]
MTTDVWALVRGDNERALEEYLEGCEGEGHRFPTSSSGRSLRADYFEQKRLREKERQALTSNRTPKVAEKPERPQSLEKLGPVKEPPPLTLLQRIRKAKMSGQLPAHDPPPVPAGDAHDQPVSHIRQIHHEATKSPSIQSTETSSSHEKPKTKITSKADAHPGDPDNIENRLQETLVLDVPPPVELHRSRELEETHSSSSTGLILQTEVSATVHVHRQSDQIHLEHHQGVDHLHGVELRREHEHYDPYKDSDEMYEQYSAPKGVLGTGQGASVSFRKDEEFEQYSAQKTIIGVGASPTSGGIGHGASITVGKSEVFEQHSGQKNIIGSGSGASAASEGVVVGHGASVTLSATPEKPHVFEQYSPPTNIVGLGASPTGTLPIIGRGATRTSSSPKPYDRYTPTGYSPSTKSPTFKVPPIPTEAIEPYSPYADVVLKKVGEQKSAHYNAYGADAEIAAASQRHLISPEPQLDESGYAIPERALSPPPDAPPTEKKWTWRGTTTSASSRSRTPTDYEVADYMMETARLDDARIEHRAVDDTPRISERVLSPVEMERVLSPVLSREHELQTKLHYDDDLSEKLRKSLQEAERSLAQPKERAVDVQHRRFEASSSVSSTDFVQEVMSRRSFNLDGAPHRAVPSTVTPPSTPLTATITSTANPLAAYARQESHLETHDEHAEYDEVTVERVQQQKVEPIYSEVAETHSPIKPKPIFKPKTEPTEQGRSQLLEEIRNRKWKPEPVVLTNYTVHTEPSRPTKPVPAPRNHEYDEVAREEPVRQASHREVFGHSQLSGTYTSTVETHLGEENIYEEIDHYQIVPAKQNSTTSQKTSAAPPPPPTSAPPPRDVHRAREEFAHRHDSSAERKFKGNKYEDEPAPEPTEDEHLDWELIYTTNAIRQMSRNNKWRESMLNKDKIPPVPKKTKELPADVLPKNSPFTRPAESPSSGRKTPTSWTKNEGFTFSVPGIQRIAVEDEMEEERSKRAAPEAWEHERVGVKQVPTNIARGHQITVPRVAQPKEVVEPQPVDRQPTHQAPVAPRRATTEESYHFQGVKNLRQQFCSPEAAPWRRTQSVGNVYEVPRARLEHGDDLRTRPGPLSEVPKGRPSSTSSLLDTTTPSTPIKQPARTHQDTPRVVRKEVTSPLPRIQSPRPRPVDLSPLTADAQQRFYTLRSPSPRAQTTPSPLARSEAELRIGGGAQPGQHFHSKPSESDQHEVRHQEHHLEKENHYEEIEHGEVIGKPEVQHQKPVEHHYDEPAKENGHHPHGPDYSPYPHHYEHTYEPHTEKENRRRAEEREKRRRAEEEEEEQRRQDVERREEDDRLWQLEQERKYEEEMRRKREGRLHSPTYRDADISRTEEHIYDQVYEPLERPERMERIEETRTQQRQHGGYHLEHYEDEEIEKTVIPVYGGHLVHDGRDMTVFPIATAHHYDEIHYQLAPEQRPPGIPEHIDLTNAEEVTVETKTKVVTIVKRRNVTGEIFEEEYLTENSTFPTSVHLTTPIHRLYDSNTPTSHYHTPAGDQGHLQRAGATLGQGASPIYDTVYEGMTGIGSGAHSNSPNSAPPPPEELVEKRDQPQYRSVGTSHSPPHQDAPNRERGELVRPIQCDPSVERNIYLAGGASLLPGLAEKVETELETVLPNTINAQVHISPWRYHAAFLGAQVVAAAASFEDSCIGPQQLQQFLTQLQATGF